MKHKKRRKFIYIFHCLNYNLRLESNVLDLAAVNTTVFKKGMLSYVIDRLGCCL